MTAPHDESNSSPDESNSSPDEINSSPDEIKSSSEATPQPSVDLDAGQKQEARAPEPADVGSRGDTQDGPAPTGKTPAAKGRKKTALKEQFGKYKIIKALGKGGMGTVYLAEDSQLDRKVAIKVPNFSDQSDTTALERFQREAKAAATISHPNLCPVYDFGEMHGVHFLVMGFIDGAPLSKFIKKDKPLPERQAAAVVRKLALALQEAHDKGVIHRDLKPANVMINKRKEPIIMDFGLARRNLSGDAQLTQTGAFMGTPYYMSPEQILGNLDAMGPPCDIFALGVILYQLTSGRLPFEGNNPMSIASKILKDEPEPLTSIVADVTPTLNAICLKAMAKKAEDRFHSMQEFADALSLYLQGRTVPQVGDDDLEMLETSGDSKPMTPDGLEVSQVAGEFFDELDVSRAALSRSTKSGPAMSSVGNQSKSGLSKRTIAMIGGGIGLAIVILVVATLVFFLPRSERGQILISLSDPDAAVSVQLDGRLIDKDDLSRPLDLEAGPHELVVEGDGYESFSNSIHVVTGVNPEFTLRVERATEDLAGEENGANAIDPIDIGVEEPRFIEMLEVDIPRRSGLFFDGIDDFVETTATLPGEGAFTIEGWFTPRRFQGGTEPGKYRIVMLTDSSSEGVFAHFKFAPRNLSASIPHSRWTIVHGRPDSNEYMVSAGQNDFPFRRTHVAIVYDGLNSQMFLDGEPGQPQEIGSGLSWNTRPLLIARDWDSTPSRKYCGIIDELMISKTARYSAAFEPLDEFVADELTIALYHFDEGTGETLVDASGNGFDGKIRGAQWDHCPEAEIDSHVANLLLDEGHQVDVRLESDGVTTRNIDEAQLLPEAPFFVIGCSFENTVSRIALEGLRELVFLESIQFNSDVSAEDLLDLAERLPSLREIHAYGRTLTDDDVAKLVAVQQAVETINLSGTQVSDLTIETLTGENELRRLWIGETMITDKAIASLSKLKRLEFVDLSDTSVTRRGVELLHSALPECEIVWNDLVIESGQLLTGSGWQGWPEYAPPPAVAPFDKELAHEHQTLWADFLGVPVEVTNSIDMELRLIPPGEFMMGSTAEEIETLLNGPDTDWFKQNAQYEGPEHRVSIVMPYRLASHEVTQVQFEHVMGFNPSQYSATGKQAAAVKGMDMSQHPVDSVEWLDACKFCNALSESEGLRPYYAINEESISIAEDGTGYRLPTEEEWEFSCYAGEVVGLGSHSDLNKFAWTVGNSNRLTHPVGELEPNAFGLHDMYGNVVEHCGDNFRRYLSTPWIELPPEPGMILSGGHSRRGGDRECGVSSVRAEFRATGGHLPGFRIALPIPMDMNRQVANSVLLFDGVDDYVDVPTIKLEDAQTLTIEALCSTADSNYQALLAIGGESSISLWKQEYWGTTFQKLNQELQLGGKASIRPNQRAHVAVVLDGMDIAMYVDGKLASGPPRKGSANTALKENLVIGALLGDTGELLRETETPGAFGGMIDSLRVSAIARYDREFSPPSFFESDDATIALYDFNDGDGDVLHDSSGHEHHGMLHGPRWTDLVHQSPDREVAEWVIGSGGRVLIRDVVVDRTEELPTWNFSINGVDLSASSDDMENQSIAVNEMLRLTNLAKLRILRADFRHPDDTERLVDLLSEVRGLRELSWNGLEIGDADLSRVVKMNPGLTRIHLCDANLSDASAATFGILKSLDSLDLSNTRVGDATIMGLGDLGSLHDLNLASTRVSDRAMSRLVQLKDLRQLNLAGTRVSDASIERLKDALQLCEIVWDDGTIAPARSIYAMERDAAEIIRQYGGHMDVEIQGRYQRVKPTDPLVDSDFIVRSVRFSRPDGRMTDRGLETLRLLSGVERLELNNQADVTARSIDAICTLRPLKHLFINGPIYDEVDLRRLVLHHPGLESLDIRPVTDRNISALTRLQSIRLLWIGDAEFTNTSMRIFGQLTSLEDLGINNNPRFMDEGLIRLRTLQNLRKLHIHHTRISDDGVGHLMQLEKLELLRANDTQIGDNGLRQLARKKTFSYLNVMRTKVTAEGVADFHEALPMCRIIWDGGTIEPTLVP